jgi:glycerol-3-phosphate acyltransferase PlsY
MLKLALGLIISYLLGSIPTAYLFGKISRGLDLRHHGSGNLGATNAFRVLGKRMGIIVLLIDILKGTLAVLLAKKLSYSHTSGISPEFYLCISALCAVCGHNWTIFLKFKGGKGIATSLGVLIAFSIIIPKFTYLVLCVVALWIIVFIVSGYVSLASVVTSLCLPLCSVIFSLPREIFFFFWVLTLFSLFKHKPNILRILRKKEHRFNPRSFFMKIFKKTLSK